MALQLRLAHCSLSATWYTIPTAHNRPESTLPLYYALHPHQQVAGLMQVTLTALQPLKMCIIQQTKKWMLFLLFSCHATQGQGSLYERSSHKGLPEPILACTIHLSAPHTKAHPHRRLQVYCGAAAGTGSCSVHGWLAGRLTGVEKGIKMCKSTPCTCVRVSTRARVFLCHFFGRQVLIGSPEVRLGGSC